MEEDIDKSLSEQLEALQKKHREEAAARRQKVRERKARTRRLIERGAIFESVLHQYYPNEKLNMEQVSRLLHFALVNPETIEYLENNIVNHQIF